MSVLELFQDTHLVTRSNFPAGKDSQKIADLREKAPSVVIITMRFPRPFAFFSHFKKDF